MVRNNISIDGTAIEVGSGIFYAAYGGAQHRAL